MPTAMKSGPRVQEKQGTWSNVFPTEQVNAQQSGLFVKKLLAVAVSSITYLRAVFPEPAFGDRVLEDLNLKVLRDDSSCPGACQVIKWLKGCFDAIDKQYLRVLVIGIFVDPDDPDTVIESYTFKFSYNDSDGPGVDIYRNNSRITSANSAAETKKATMRLLRTIVLLTQSLQSLPDDVMMTVKLLYYDDVTPEDYEPPGFTAAVTDIFKFQEDPMNIKVGAVNTPFHSVKLRIKTDAKQFDEAEGGREEETQVEGKMKADKAINNTGLDEESETMDIQRDYNLAARGRVNEPMEGDSVPTATPARPGADEQAVSTTGSQASSAAVNHDDQAVRCPCGCNEDDGLMILCTQCKFWQHGVCFAIMSEKEAPESHICTFCANPHIPGLEPTDPSLFGLSLIAIQASCLWRRTLHACTESNRILHSHLARRLGVDSTVAAGLVNRLEKEGFLKKTSGRKKLGKLVDTEKLKTEGLNRYLRIHGPNTATYDSSCPSTQEEPPTQENKSKAVGKAGKSIDSEIEKLTSKAESINITGKRRPAAGKHDAEVKSNEESGGARGNRKRVRSKDGDSEEFDVALSQESSQGSKKRRKASIANKTITV